MVHGRIIKKVENKLAISIMLSFFYFKKVKQTDRRTCTIYEEDTTNIRIYQE